MVSSILKVGDKVEIRAVQQVENQKQEGMPPRVMKSVIYDMKDDGTLELGMPTEGNKMVLLALGIRYELVFYAKGGLYQCIGQVKERYKSDNLYMVSMELKSNLSKLQRREYYRFECLLDIQFFIITAEEAMLENSREILIHHEQAYPNDELHKGIAVDISGGGLRFVSEESMEIKSTILVRLHLVNENIDREFWVPGIILQKRKLDKELVKYEYRVKLYMKDTRVREQIIKYIFEEERKSRKNEKG